MEVNCLVCRIQLLNSSFPSSSGKCFALWYLGHCNIALNFCSLLYVQSHFLHLCSYFCHLLCLLIFHSNSQQKHQRLRGNWAFSTRASLCRVFCLLITISNKQNPDKWRGGRGCSRWAFVPFPGCFPLLAGLQRYNHKALILLLWGEGFLALQGGFHWAWWCGKAEAAGQAVQGYSSSPVWLGLITCWVRITL